MGLAAEKGLRGVQLHLRLVGLSVSATATKERRCRPANSPSHSPKASLLSLQSIVQRRVIEAMVSVWGGNRVSVRIAPSGAWNGLSDSTPIALFDYVAKQLNRFGLAYLHIIEPRIKGTC